MELAGLLSYFVFFASFACIYAIMALGLNIQWGMTGQINIGVAGFYAVGAYTSAILTTPPTPEHLGGFALPVIVGLIGAVIVSGLLAVLIGMITVNLRSDYLAIATIGLAEIIRFLIKNEEQVTHGVRGIAEIPRPLVESGPLAGPVFLVVALICVAIAYFLVERARVSPWGRVLRAIRDNEDATKAAGKNVVSFRLQAFVVGSALMGFAGGLYAHFFGFISPEAFQPVFGTFIVWAMLIVGGSGNNKGALLGTVLVWLVWSGTEIFTRLLPADMATQASAARVLMIGVLLQIVLLTRRQGVLPEERPKPIPRGDS
ncbi:branched-chain amino acid ABC transporter permease [Dichotomicrobium thermohalophilum]|uniref:Amino acid/amide ABC transporter membrane protein 2 (HAAT family) n=1 Tax=Dichotomicrobium thermohalophilum TaxID=933063 RepID=A0A397Q1K2_9HYPH|nr:branched-chain amino acid ABC transporter permease [Dichotomicrobium thermohalophilum]RIA55266.1 amino acid/amide ABC transporter membrane protein 2 (HAAT family) [Dichotomicrobium thermohalophilum]